MTAYLRRGDSIYLAVPVSPTHRTPESAHAEAERTVTDLTAVFNRHGVTVASWSGHSQIGRPEVVAVFRTEERVND